MPEPETLTLITEYIVSRAQYKAVVLLNAEKQERRLPKARYADQIRDLVARCQVEYPQATITHKMRNVCEEQEHGLRGTVYLYHSRDKQSLYVKCHCGNKRLVPAEDWCQANPLEKAAHA